MSGERQYEVTEHHILTGERQSWVVTAPSIREAKARHGNAPDEFAYRKVRSASEDQETRSVSEHIERATASALDMEGADDDGPVVVIHPGRMSGAPTINRTRITAATVADCVFGQGVEVTMDDYELTRHAVLVACWYEWLYDDNEAKRRWAEGAQRALGGWGSAPAVEALPDPPRRGALHDQEEPNG